MLGLEVFGLPSPESRSRAPTDGSPPPYPISFGRIAWPSELATSEVFWLPGEESPSATGATLPCASLHLMFCGFGPILSVSRFFTKKSRPYTTSSSAALLLSLLPTPHENSARFVRVRPIVLSKMSPRNILYDCLAFARLGSVLLPPVESRSRAPRARLSSPHTSHVVHKRSTGNTLSHDFTLRGIIFRFDSERR